jgi:hypothetical protein
VKDDVTNRVFTDQCHVLLDASGIFKYVCLHIFVQKHQLIVLVITSGRKSKDSNHLVET